MSWPFSATLENYHRDCGRGRSVMQRTIQDTTPLWVKWASILFGATDQILARDSMVILVPDGDRPPALPLKRKHPMERRVGIGLQAAGSFACVDANHPVPHPCSPR